MSRKCIPFVLIAFLSAAVFASPGNGGRGGGGPSGGSRGGRQNSPAPSRPSTSPAARPSAPSPASPSPAPSKGNSPARNGNPPPAPRAGGSHSSSADAPEIMNYRGSRIISGTGDFTLRDIKSERKNSREISVELTFSQIINPLSFTAESIIFDGEAISGKTKFAFNKKGDTIRVSVPTEKEFFSLKIQNVESFDGTQITPIELTNIEIGGRQ